MTVEDVTPKLTVMEQNILIDSTAGADLTYALMELAGDEVVEEGTEEWLNKVDRRGLWHVNDDAYNLFVGFEYTVKKVLKIERDINKETFKKKLHDSTLADEEIKFNWSLLSAEVDEKAATLVINEMVSLFITVRGFAFTTSYVELYKQTQKKLTE